MRWNSLTLYLEQARPELELKRLNTTRPLVVTKQYAIIGSAITIFLVVGIGSLPFTIWNANGDGVPRADEWVYCLFFVMLYVGTLCGCMFYGGMYSSFDPPVAPKLHFGWLHTWRARMPVMVVAEASAFGIGLILPLLLGESPRFLLMDSISFMIAFTAALITGEMVARWSAGGEAPVRHSIRQVRRQTLLLRDDEGEARVSLLK